jgi:cytochrome c peroxidase
MSYLSKLVYAPVSVSLGLLMLTSCSQGMKGSELLEQVTEVSSPVGLPPSSTPPNAAAAAMLGNTKELAAADAALAHEVNPTTLAGIPTTASLASRTTKCLADPRAVLGLVSVDICVGADLFFRDTFNGNGRTCGTCHPSANNLTLDPPFIATLPFTDPLFVAQTNPNLSGLEHPDLQHSFSLILENIDGFQSPTTQFFMRSVPHLNGLAVTIQAAATSPGPDGTTLPPNERVGLSGDGAPFNDPELPTAKGALLDFMQGAIRQHYTKTLNRNPSSDFTFATAAELNEISAFMHTIGRTNEIDLTTFTLADSGAAAGQSTFQAKPCNACHHNAGANFVVDGINRNFNTGVETARIPTLDAQGIPTDTGFQLQGTFNTVTLIEAANTPPFFHTNAFNTIEDAIGFYTTAAFGDSPAGKIVGGPIALTPTDIANVGRFLRVLNASFNTQLALSRLNASSQMVANFGTNFNLVQTTELKLAAKQLNDAFTDLVSVPGLFVPQQGNLQGAITLINQAAATSNVATRQTDIDEAISIVSTTTADFTSTGTLSFTIGAGSLMF